MPQIVMVALRDLEMDTLAFGAGEVFMCTPIQAARLNFARSARFAEAHECLPDMEPSPALSTPSSPVTPIEPEECPPTRRTRTYRRRDLTAEGS